MGIRREKSILLESLLCALSCPVRLDSGDTQNTMADGGEGECAE